MATVYGRDWLTAAVIKSTATAAAANPLISYSVLVPSPLVIHAITWYLSCLVAAVTLSAWLWNTFVLSTSKDASSASNASAGSMAVQVGRTEGSTVVFGDQQKEGGLGGTQRSHVKDE